MDDWQVALKKVLEERERKRAEIDNRVVTSKKPGTKKNRGLGAYPLLRLRPKVYFPKFEDDELEVFNWRRSPMER